MSGSLPTSYLYQLQQKMQISNPTIIRNNTNRSCIKYSVEWIKPDPNSQECFIKFKILVLEKISQLKLGEKILIYCQSTKNMQIIAENLKCEQYHNGIENKEIILKNFISNNEIQLLVCSTALSAGFDHNSIRYVFHYHFYLSFLDFVQGSGRAGRDQKQSYSICIMPQGFKFSTYSKNQLKPNDFDASYQDKKMMQAYLLEKCCYRSVLSFNLDDISQYTCDENDVKCQLCQIKYQLRSNPMVKFSQNEEIIIQIRNQIEYQFLQFQFACLFCASQEHIALNCVKFPEMIKTTKIFQNYLRTSSELEHGSCCFWCLLPQHEWQFHLEAINPNQKCEFADILLSYASWIWHTKSRLELLSMGFDINHEPNKNYLQQFFKQFCKFKYSNIFMANVFLLLEIYWLDNSKPLASKYTYTTQLSLNSKINGKYFSFIFVLIRSITNSFIDFDDMYDISDEENLNLSNIKNSKKQFTQSLTSTPLKIPVSKTVSKIPIQSSIFSEKQIDSNSSNQISIPKISNIISNDKLIAESNIKPFWFNRFPKKFIIFMEKLNKIKCLPCYFGKTEYGKKFPNHKWIDCKQVLSTYNENSKNDFRYSTFLSWIELIKELPWESSINGKSKICFDCGFGNSRCSNPLKTNKIPCLFPNLVFILLFIGCIRRTNLNETFQQWILKYFHCNEQVQVPSWETNNKKLTMMPWEWKFFSIIKSFC